MRKGTITLLIVVLGMAGALFAGTYSGGSGTEADPYQIATKADLKTLSETPADWDKHFIQTADIEFTTADFESGGDFYNDGMGFNRIGEDWENYFNGSYDGQGYVIDGLVIHPEVEEYGSMYPDSYVGFFGYTHQDAVIENLGITNCDIIGNSDVGGLVGSGYGSSITNCYTTGTVHGYSYVGGFIGQNRSNINSCYSSAEVSGDYNKIGGFAGDNYAWDISSYIKNCYSTGNVTRTDQSSTSFGGFCGAAEGYMGLSAIFENCYSTGRVIYSNGSDPTDKGFLGDEDGSINCSNNFFDSETSQQTSSIGATGKTTTEMKTLSTFTNTGWDFVDETANGSNDYWNMNSTDNDGYPFLSWQEFGSQGPATQATSIAFSDVGTTSMTVSWTRGDGDSCAVFLKQASVGTASPVDDAYYAADTVFSSGDQIGTSGWYAVYRGTDTTVTITGLSDNTTYRAHVCEFNTGSIYYNSDSTTGNPANQTTVEATPEIDVRGNYVSIADGDESPSLTDHTDFDSVQVSFGTQQRTYTIHNTGTGPLYLGALKSGNSAATSSIEIPTNIVTISGDHSDNFTVTTQPASTVAAGDSTTFVVKFDPSARGVRSATVTFYNTDSDESPYTFDIQGVGLASEIDVRGNYVSIADGDESPSLTDHTDFDSVVVSNGYLERTYSIYNTGNKTLYLGSSQADARNEKPVKIELDNPVVIGGTNSADFTVTQEPSLEISPGDSTTFTVKFDPLGIGTRSATISVYSDDSDENPYNFSIKGFGMAPEIDVQGNYVSIENGDDSPSLTDHTDFDSVSISYDSQQRTYTIHNTGSGTLYLGTPVEKNAAAPTIEIPAEIVTISGDHSDDFTVTTQPASSVAAGDSTTFIVEFDPSATGTRSATVNVTNNDSDENPFSFAVQGLGTTPEIDVRGNYLSIADGDTTPSAEDSTSFGSAAVDDGTINRTFRIFNTGNETLNIGLRESSVDLNEFSGENSGPSEIVFINGTHADDFSVTEQPDSHSIQPGDSVSFTVQFDPAAGGTRTANIYFFNNDSDEENYNFYISGIGITPPTVTTATFDSITVISAVGGGNVTDNGGASVTARGVCWGLAENPTVDSSHTSDGTGTGEFTSSLTGLAHGTTYHVRAYATNSAGTGYGPDSTFTTKQIIISTSPSDTLLKGGQEVTYTVSIANVLPAMRGYTMHVGYNGAHFSDATITEGTYLSSVGTTEWDATGSDGSYDIDCVILGTTDGQTGDGTLFTVQLTTASTVTDSLVNPESANLTISSVTMRDVINDPITCDQSNGATIVIDTAPPTMETIAENDSVWYRSGPTLSNFGFDDNYALECVGYKINDGDWDVISDDITGTEYNNDGISLPTYSALAERTAVHTIYFYAVDDALNRAGYDDASLHFSFYKDETAPVGDLGITFTDVTTTGMNAVGAAFEDATQGEEYYQFDCTTSATYDRARTLADSIHECTGMTANTQYTFKYQVSDGVADPNASPAWNATAWSSEYSKYTLSVAPTTETVTCDKSGTISTTTLRFTAVGGFGAGKIEYYRYVLDDSATHTWTGSETQWSSGTLMLGIPTANTNYYLHVKGYNGEDVANGTLALGPYQWDGTPINPVTELNFNATGGDSNSISMDWTNPENDAHGIEIWLKGYGTYPQYVGSVPDFPSTPTEASNSGWTKAHDSLTTSHTSTPAGRNFYYCAIFVKDLVSHYSAAVIDSSLSYWLGDVNEAPDGQVNAADIAILASAYRTSLGDDYYAAVCDVGPTVTHRRMGRPVPDGAIGFEDLMIVAMNYENTGDDEKKSEKSKAKTTINPIALKLNIQKVGTQFVAQLQMDENDGHVKGLYVPVSFGSDLSFTQVRQGNLVSGSDFFDARQEGNTVYISAAALENSAGFDGNGVIAEIILTVNGANSAIQFGDAQARTASNAEIELTYNYTDVALLTEGLVPTEYKLHQNYPNPFNPSTTIMYDLKESGRVKITLFNINGQRIATVLDQVKDAGYHSYVYEAGNLPSGVYIYRIEVNDFRDVRKLVLMK